MIGCGIQHLEESERQELFNNWKDYTSDDDYSQSTVSSIGELDLDENNGDENSSEDGQDIVRHGNYLIEVVDSNEDSFLVEEEDHNANDQCSYVDANGDYGATNPFDDSDSEEDFEPETTSEMPYLRGKRSARIRN